MVRHRSIAILQPLPSAKAYLTGLKTLPCRTPQEGMTDENVRVDTDELLTAVEVCNSNEEMCGTSTARQTASELHFNIAFSTR